MTKLTSENAVRQSIGFLNTEADACRSNRATIAANTFTLIANQLGALLSERKALEAENARLKAQCDPACPFSVTHPTSQTPKEE